MSKFSVLVKKILAIEPHNNADTLEFAVIDGYRSIVRKAMYREGDLIAYIPEGAVIPSSILKKLGLWDEKQSKGKCAGEKGNRVRALMLRGKMSQGIVYPLQQAPGGSSTVSAEQWMAEQDSGSPLKVQEGQDLAGFLGITKFQPEIPAELEGLVFDGGIEVMPNFDVEDIKKYPDVLAEGEMVVMREKLHGTFSGFLLVPVADADAVHGRLRVFSKGLAQNALAFQLVPGNAANVYCKAACEFKVEQKLLALERHLETQHGVVGQPVFFFGEVFGSASRQDLKYGEKLSLCVFDVGYGYRSSPIYLNDDALQDAALTLGLTLVPEIYRGPFSADALKAATSGKETLSGKALHIREGVVVRPLTERRNTDLGRVILKSVSPEYLVRSGDATEFQ